MINPIDFQIMDFLTKNDSPRAITSLQSEALTGSELVDNLILLRFCNLYSIQQVLKSKYNLNFAWLNSDPTPPEFREIAERHHIIVEKSKNLIVYIPLGIAVDDSMLAIDIPNYQIVYRYIADCNYRLLKTRFPSNLLSEAVAPYRPLLVFRRLVIDCISATGTDLHFASSYANKQPRHVISYRVKGELKPSPFIIDRGMMVKLLHTVIAKQGKASAMDLDSPGGITTEIRDLFGDGTCDIRVTGVRSDAGYYVDFAIQTVTTTTKTVDELGFLEEDVEHIRQLAKRRSGLTLVTGKMRSGKNTTIFAMLNEIINEPIRIIEYSNPIENHMDFPQINYEGNVERLMNLMRLAKKMDLDVAVLNEIPNAEVAFAVRDLVNSSISVITTTHIDRVWHVPYKLQEFFGDDYKTIVSQLNVVINHKMFRRWKSPDMQKRTLIREQGAFELFCYTAGVRQYFVPTDENRVQYTLQPLVEIMEFTDAMKTAMLDFKEVWRAEQMIANHIKQEKKALEHKLAEYINNGQMSLDEMRILFH